MERQLGIGVIGIGWMGRVHTASYKRALEHFPELGVRPRLAVACDISADRRRHAALMGFERTVEDWRAVVEDPSVDVISVTTPNALHREIATAAIEAGKHVWVEKPVGRGRRRDDRGGRGGEEGRRGQRRGVLLPLRAGRRARPRPDRRRSRRRGQPLPRASSSPTTRTARTRRRRGASSGATRGRACWAT